MQVACVPGLDGGSTQEFAAEVRKKRLCYKKTLKTGQKAQLMSRIRRAFLAVLFASASNLK
jgi:hypothetical protein